MPAFGLGGICLNSSLPVPLSMASPVPQFNSPFPPPQKRPFLFLPCFDTCVEASPGTSSFVSGVSFSKAPPRSESLLPPESFPLGWLLELFLSLLSYFFQGVTLPKLKRDAGSSFSVFRMRLLSVILAGILYIDHIWYVLGTHTAPFPRSPLGGKM